MALPDMKPSTQERMLSEAMKDNYDLRNEVLVWRLDAVRESEARKHLTLVLPYLLLLGVCLATILVAITSAIWSI